MRISDWSSDVCSSDLIRLLATSNRDLEASVANGSFRADLYFRLTVVNIQLPPLRQRPQDIPPLAQHFAAKYSEANGLPRLAVTPQALDRLMAPGWSASCRPLRYPTPPPVPAPPAAPTGHHRH